MTVAKLQFNDISKYRTACDYCRELIKQPEYPMTLHLYRGDMLCLVVDVEGAAKLDLLEGKHDGPRHVKYKDKTMSEETKRALASRRARKGVDVTP